MRFLNWVTESDPAILREAYSQKVKCPMCNRMETLNFLFGRMRVAKTRLPSNRAIFLLETDPVFESSWAYGGSLEAEQKIIQELAINKQVLIVGPCEFDASKGNRHWKMCRGLTEPWRWPDEKYAEVRPVDPNELRRPMTQSNQSPPPPPPPDGPR